ncbi:MAG: valine--tRNA ligase [Puniceicoccales bacterium]|nr:valine--tRNA ligase [Puniceicoccales bacterium]
MNKEFHFSEVEGRLYAEWERSGGFAEAVDFEKKSYAILMPPPNVTGVLHMGHLLNNTLQDILIRRAWQEGKNVLWQPGTDHAGISMQVRVEKELVGKGVDPKALSREEFLVHAERWRDTHGNIIFHQLRNLGICCDFGKKVHTLDGDYSRTVLHGFVELFRRGYIRRGRRMVNWCPVSQTALSDEEVLVRECPGKLYRLRYEILEEPGTHIEICTTRPETIGGDVAVAVHPEDERHRHFIGKHCWRPFCREPIPIIADGAVDKNFGAGALKITPAHAAVDFEIGQRHGLPFREVIGPDGILNGLAGETLGGLDRATARERAVKLLRVLGNFVAEEDHVSAVGISERSGEPIEPRLSEQWFLRYPGVDLAKRAVAEGWIRFFPRRWEKTYLRWLENIRDWCISRQLRWGHRIPVWYRKGEDREDPRHWHVSVDGPSDPEHWERDGDVLDTWFSSAFWPLGTLGWPDEESMGRRHFAAFFPTSAMVTGPDIIFFWVARMVFMALEFIPGKDGKDDDLSGRVPFRSVYFTGIVRDERGRKMSKSLGNSPEPLDLIARYGADGVRFGLVTCAPQGLDILFAEGRLEQGRNFCTKLWNVCRFRLLQGDVGAKKSSVGAILLRVDPKNLDAIDRCILENLVAVGEEIERAMGNYEFQGTLLRMDRFFRDDYCDWYVETCKVRWGKDLRRQATLLAVQDLILRRLLQLLSPFVPFVTQELWRQLGFGDGKEILHRVPMESAEWLRAALEAADLLASGGELASVGELRQVLPALRALGAGDGLYHGGTPGECQRLEPFRELLPAMSGHGELKKLQQLEGMTAAVTSWGTFAVASGGDGGRDSKRRELEIVRGHIATNRKKLEDRSFLERAPAAIVDGARNLLAENLEREKKLLRLLSE